MVNEAVSPSQGGRQFFLRFPGRCPGLSYFGPFGAFRNAEHSNETPGAQVLSVFALRMPRGAA